ncbi:hypothetical protein BGX34_003687, partial [Mortierella sp. NVP85]
MKISLTLAAMCTLLVATSTHAFQVCRTDWQDGNTCGYNCENNDPYDNKWCENFKNAMTKAGNNCWGNCYASGGPKFWCSKSSMSVPQCDKHYWRTD